MGYIFNINTGSLKNDLEWIWQNVRVMNFSNLNKIAIVPPLNNFHPHGYEISRGTKLNGKAPKTSKKRS